MLCSILERVASIIYVFVFCWARVGVPEFDPRTASTAKESAALLRASQLRLRDLLEELRVIEPSLAACGFHVGFMKQRESFNISSEKEPPSSFTSGGPQVHYDVAAKAVGAVAPALGLDMEALRQLLKQTREVLARMSR